MIAAKGTLGTAGVAQVATTISMVDAAGVSPMTQAIDDSEFPVAAIVACEHAGVDQLLADFAHRLQQDGWRVRGLVQRSRRDNGSDPTVLVDLDSGTCFPLFQDLGSGSVSCCVDPRGVAAASIVLRQALDAHADLVIANRFGALEAEGGGLAAEMLAVMSERIPLLTIVAEPYIGDWRRFNGSTGVDLPARFDALQAWFSKVRLRPQRCFEHAHS